MGAGSDPHLSREADVVVVGAGLAGLIAARVVARAGLEPLVLEARDRVGGRVLGAPIGDGAVAELGGQWVGYRDARLRSLLAELEIDVFPTFDRGAHLIETRERARRYRGSIPRLRPRALLDLGRARWRMDRRARRVPADAPWEAPRAREHDDTVLDSWLDENLHAAEARSLLDVAVATIWGEDPHGISLLCALSFISVAGSFDALSSTRGGLLQDRVAGGPTRLAETLAAELGERVACDCPVTSIADRGAGVEVAVGALRVTARRAIVTAPPSLAARIRFEPALPASRETALRSLPPGSVIKILAVYERPFWREHGLSGRAVTVRGPVTSTFDNSPPAGQPGVLVGFVPGKRARELASRPPAERRERVLETFTRLYGPEAARPQAYLEKDWTADPWTRGCYFGLPARGAITSLMSTFGAPTGAIHWAGAETALSSYGGMDGAVLSGERAGAEVIAALGER
jgi:monoamine oxidase